MPLLHPVIIAIIFIISERTEYIMYSVYLVILYVNRYIAYNITLNRTMQGYLHCIYTFV